MSSEDDFERQVRFLERELAAAREMLRDRFAMAALTGTIAAVSDIGEAAVFSDSIANDCYRVADAMMEARKS